MKQVSALFLLMATLKISAVCLALAIIGAGSKAIFAQAAWKFLRAFAVPIFDFTHKKGSGK